MLNKLSVCLLLALIAVVCAQSNYEILFNRPDITGLTGGAATNLDGIPTTGLAVGTILIIYDGSETRIYRLTAGTDDENPPSIIKPDDFADPGNAKVWKARISSKPSEAGFNDNDWTYRITDGADTTLITGGKWGIARAGATMYGYADSTHVNLGVACTTGYPGSNIKHCTVGGGYYNTASKNYTTVGGGVQNAASELYSTVGGGNNNTASNVSATVSGGGSNTAIGTSATVGGGYGNIASNLGATVGGGSSNTASGEWATVGGGFWNNASGWVATIPGGKGNTAAGRYSFAAGHQAKANHNGAFVWADTTSANFASTGVNQFLIRAGGNVGINLNNPSKTLDVNGGIMMRSDRYWGVSGGSNPDTFYIFADTNATDITTDDTIRFNGNMPIKIGSGSLIVETDGDVIAAQNLNVGGTITGNGSGLTGVPGDNLGNYLATQNLKMSGFWVSNDGDNEGVYVDATGKVGIGTETPAYILDINGNMRIEGNSPVLLLGSSTTPSDNFHITADLVSGARGLRIWNGDYGAGTILASIQSNGCVGIGTSRTSYSTDKLNVNGNVRVGMITNDDGGIPGVGDKLCFSGSDDWPLYDSDNSDPIWMGRYNSASDESQLRISIGDEAQNADKLEVGYTSTANIWNPVFVVEMNGKVGIGTTSPGGLLHVGINGLIIKATGEIQTTGVGYGTVAGNARGTGAVDLQTYRDAATQVASGTFATVGGGYSNTAGGGASTVGGGESNTANYSYATVGGGYSNAASGGYAAIGGGLFNTVSADYATVSGGYSNDVSGFYATVSGGEDNTASGDDATVGGGVSNIAGIVGATVGGGSSNAASGGYAAVGGGIGNTASGDYATVPGGSGNIAAGTYSFAAGRRAKANHNGAFVWADNTDADFASTSVNQFLIRAGGGVGIGTTSPTSILDINGSSVRVRSSSTPASSSADGYTGEIRWDASYIYICTDGDGPGGSADTWKRSAISTW